MVVSIRTGKAIWPDKGLVRLCITLVIHLCYSFYSATTLASGIENLMKYSQEGSLGNHNKAAIMKDQMGGYMTGGSILLRGPRPKVLQPLVVQTPRFSFDACTGSADFRFGGLSYISSAEFSHFLKSMSTAAGAYAVKMLIKSSCPQCEDIMSYLETVARDINGMMIDQCQAAQKIVDGSFGKLVNSDQQKCMMQGNMVRANRDMYESTDRCKSNPDQHGRSGEDDELKSLLGDEFNLVWKAITKGTAEGADHRFLEMIMSVSGTIIGRKIEGRYHFTPKPSLVLSNDLLDQYIGTSHGGGKLKRYRCNEHTKCLELSEEELTLSQNETLYGNISRILTGLVGKVIEGKGETITDEEEAVIAFSSIPLVNLIEMELASKARTEDLLVRVSEFVEVVCYDVITNFLSQMVTKAQSSVEALEYAQIADIRAIKDFTENAERVKSFLRDAKFAAFKRLQIITQVKERLTLQEKAFENGFSRFMQQVR
jgi:conjugative transfer pilus assembly protein TraH